MRFPTLSPELSATSPTATKVAAKAVGRRLCLIPLVWLWNVVLLLERALCMQSDQQDEHRVHSAVRNERSANNHASESAGSQNLNKHEPKSYFIVGVTTASKQV